MRTFSSADKLKAAVGEELGASDWVTVEQQRIDQFAEATGDRQWIHTDPERSARESPYGRTIAHGFLTLSLVTQLLEQSVRLDGLRMGVNYGFNRVRFPAPVPEGARIRGRFALQAFEEISGGAQITWAVTVEVEGGAKPGCVAEWIGRLYWDQPGQ